MTTYARIFSANSQDLQFVLGKQIIRAEQIRAQAIAARVKTPAARLAQAEQVKTLNLMIESLARTARTNQQQLNTISSRTARFATRQIREHIASTTSDHRIGPTGGRPGLSRCISSNTLRPNTGWVGVASKDELDKAKNRHGAYGPYWRAQEYGTGAPAPGGDVPSQLKRKIFGYFFGAGGTGVGSRPDHQYSGEGGPHPVFIDSKDGAAGRGPRGGKGGKGTIQHEIKGRHFIRDGADAAFVKWEKDMRDNDRAAAKQIEKMTTAARRSSGRTAKRRA